MYGDPLLTAFVCVRSNGGAQALAVSATVAVASVCEAVPVEPGHIHLDSTHTQSVKHTHTKSGRQWANQGKSRTGQTGGGPTERESSFQ